MTWEERQKFLYMVQTTIEQHPDLFNETILACTHGIQEAYNKLKQRACDMEMLAVALHSTMDKRYSKNTEKYINELGKQKKIEPYLKTACSGNLSNVLDDL